MQKYAMIDGIPIRYAIEGNGEKVFLILHGFIEGIELFENFISKLATKGKVVMLDLPGCGMSGFDRREVLSMDYFSDIAFSLLDILNIKKVTIIGHSMGGYVACYLAEKHIEYIDKIVLLHSTPFAATETRKKERENDLQIVLSGKKNSLIDINSKGRFASENHKKFKDQIMDMAEAVDMSDDSAVAAQIRGLITRDSKADFFANCKLPKLLIFGIQDSYITIERAKSVAEAFPDAETLWLEHSGHMGFIEEPDIIIEHIS